LNLQIFEWWYFRKYGASFIEQVSLNHISPWISGSDSNSENNSGTNGNSGASNSSTSNSSNAGGSAAGTSSSSQQTVPGDPYFSGLNCMPQSDPLKLTDCSSVTYPNFSVKFYSECKVWRNPLNLFRGSEYQRFYWAANKEPLTYYDMNLSAQDHQTFFTCEGDGGKKEYECRCHDLCFCKEYDGKLTLALF